MRALLGIALAGAAACGPLGPWSDSAPENRPVVRRTVVESHTTTQAEGSALTEHETVPPGVKPPPEYPPPAD